MDKEEFERKLRGFLDELKIELNEKQINQFYEYMEILLHWNEKINLTAITQPDEIILKHFVDSITISKNIRQGTTLVDVGTGAGFPGIPLKIIRDDLKITLVDTLNKRIVFLQDVIQNLGLKNVKTVHARAEDLARNKMYREKFDYATSRAVANLSVLVEYMLPLVKIDGSCLCMKGPDIENELDSAKNAISILGGRFVKMDNFLLPKSDMVRNVVVIKKIKGCPLKYPRKAGIPVKEPLM